MFSHAIFMPGLPGWLDRVDRDSPCSGRIRSRATRWETTPTSNWPAPWRLEREEDALSVLRTAVKAGLVNVCVAQGSVPAEDEPAVPASAAVCGCAGRRPGGPRLAATNSSFPLGIPFHRLLIARASKHFDRPGASTGPDLAEIPEKFCVNNATGPWPDLRAEHGSPSHGCAPRCGSTGQRARCRPCGWGTDAVWTGSPSGRSMHSAASNSRRHATQARIRPVG